MRRMDPEFAKAFSNDFPEAYGATLRNQRRRGVGSTSDATIAIHVPVIPPLVSRLVAGIVVMLILVGGFFVISEATGNNTLGVPSGQAMNSSAGSNFDSAEVSQRVAEGVAPLKEVHSGFSRGWSTR